MHAGTHVRVYVYPLACMQACTLAYVHACTLAHMHVCTHARMHASTHTCVGCVIKGRAMLLLPMCGRSSLGEEIGFLRLQGQRLRRRKASSYRRSADSYLEKQAARSESWDCCCESGLCWVALSVPSSFCLLAKSERKWRDSRCRCCSR